MSERCERCGEVGEDLRTLWMACFYAMNELPIPFTQCAIRGRYAEQVGFEHLPTLNINVPEWGDFLQSDQQVYPFYTLRVCKDCRADWMAAIQAWFMAPPTEREGSGSGIYIREHGAVREITEREWHTRQQNAPARSEERGHTLPADVTRCLDDGCPERHECLRWLDRLAANSNPRVSVVASLFPYDIPLGEACPAKIDTPARSGSS